MGSFQTLCWYAINKIAHSCCQITNLIYSVHLQIFTKIPDFNPQLPTKMSKTQLDTIKLAFSICKMKLFPCSALHWCLGRSNKKKLFLCQGWPMREQDGWQPANHKFGNSDFDHLWERPHPVDRPRALHSFSEAIFGFHKSIYWWFII